jgi:hypothetical protein
MIRPCCLLAILAVGGICILAPPGAASAPPDTTGEPGLALASKLQDASAPKPMGWEYSCPCQAGDASWVNKYLAAEDECGCNNADWSCCSQPALFGYADYLNWAARRPGLDFAAVVPLPAPPGAPVPLVTDALDLGRSGDVRVGIGYRFAAGWDLALNYTHFYTANQASVSQGASGTWELLATRSLFDTIPMNSIEADGSLRLNMLDLEANWRSLLDDTLGFRAFAGFRWAEIDQQFDNTYQYVLGFTPITGTIHLPSNMNAEGIRFGAELEWRAGYGLRIFGRGAQSLLLADFHMRHFESDTRSATPLLNVPVNTSQIVPVLEAAAGIAWGRGPWEISAGYEMSNWFNMADLDRTSESLFIDGAFVRLAFSR